MFGLGLGEILIVVLVLFLISPNNLPDILRAFGRILGKIRAFVKESGAKEILADLRDQDSQSQSGMSHSSIDKSIVLALLKLEAIKNQDKPGKEASDFYFALLFAPDSFLQNLALRVLHNDKVFATEPREGENFESEAEDADTEFGRIQHFMATLEGLDEKNLRDGMRYFARLPGAPRLKPLDLFERRGGNLGQLYKDYRQQGIKTKI